MKRIVIVSAIVLFAGSVLAQSIGAIRTTPTEKFTVNPGHRDWTEAAISGSTIVSGNSSNRGGLFAVDTASGKLKWTARPTATVRSNPFVATRPVFAGDVVVVPMGETLMALNLATGKEVWRGPQTALRASAAAGSGLVFVRGADDNFYALDAATGREKWKNPPARRDTCYSLPIFSDGTVFVAGAALDAATGQERWRYPVRNGECFTQSIASGDTFFVVGDSMLYAIDRATGRDRWKPVEIRGMVEGRDRLVNLFGLVDAGDLLVGLTPSAMLAFDKKSGKTAWRVPGEYRESAPSTAVAGRVLYFQGPSGTLNGLDLDTRAILWSFKRPTAEANWAFGFVTPVDGGLWVDSYQALVKLQ